MLLFWDVDTQHDFMDPDGLLYVPGAEAIVPALARLREAAHARGIRVLATADDHEPGHRELSDRPDFRETFPPHCMRGTPGQRKIDATRLRDPLVLEPAPQDADAVRAAVAAHAGDLLVHKHWFDAFTNPNLGPALDALQPTDIVLYGVATDVCNRFAIEGLLQSRPDAVIWFVEDAARAIHPEAVPGLVADWVARGVRLTTTDEVAREGGLADRLAPPAR